MRLILLALALLVSHPAMAANWLRAETDHYVVHADMSEEQLRELAQLMEDFDQLLVGIFPPQTQRGRKVEFYIQDNWATVKKISRLNNEGLDFDVPEIAASLATFDQSRSKIHWYRSIFSDQASFYIRNAFWRPNPPWVEDGFGSFFATTYVNDDGSFIIGAPEILSPLQGSASASRLQKMMTAGRPPDTASENNRFRTMNQEAIVSIFLEPEYAGALTRYLDSLASGKTMEGAILEIGELETLASKINQRRSKPIPYIRQIKRSEGGEHPIVVRAMKDDEIALILPRMKRLDGRDLEDTAETLKTLTESHVDSALVWYEYAAAEFERVRERELGGTSFRGFGFSNYEIIVNANPYSDAEAWRAVNRALELQPEFAPALRLKAEILMARLIRSGDTDDAEGFDAVRELLAPIAADPEREPLAAAVYFQSFVEQGRDPPAEAIEQLGRAFIANPGIEEFRYAYAVALSRSGEKDVARRLLSSMLNDPVYRDAAQRALDQG